MRQTQTRRPTTYFEELSDADRTARLHAMLADRPNTDDVWVFAYGSLIWRPCFAYVERLKATLAGYRRRLEPRSDRCLAQNLTRGTVNRACPAAKC